MPHCEESFVAKLDPMGESQLLSAQPCHKKETTLSPEGTSLVTEEGTSVDCIKDCSSGTSASKIPTKVTNAKLDSVSGINTESLVDHANLQSCDNEPSEPSPSPVRLRRSTRSTKGIPPTRYGSITSHQLSIHDIPGRKVEFFTIYRLIDDICI